MPRILRIALLITQSNLGTNQDLSHLRLLPCISPEWTPHGNMRLSTRMWGTAQIPRLVFAGVPYANRSSSLLQKMPSSILGCNRSNGSENPYPKPHWKSAHSKSPSERRKRSGDSSKSHYGQIAGEAVWTSSWVQKKKPSSSWDGSSRVVWVFLILAYGGDDLLFVLFMGQTNSSINTTIPLQATTWKIWRTILSWKRPQTAWCYHLSKHVNGTSKPPTLTGHDVGNKGMITGHLNVFFLSHKSACLQKQHNFHWSKLLPPNNQQRQTFATSELSTGLLTPPWMWLLQEMPREGFGWLGRRWRRIIELRSMWGVKGCWNRRLRRRVLMGRLNWETGAKVLWIRADSK